jgi:hypothetical protein
MQNDRVISEHLTMFLFKINGLLEVFCESQSKKKGKTSGG